MNKFNKKEDGKEKVGSTGKAQEDAEEGMCGKLKKAMYGARGVAQNWEYECNDFMKADGVHCREGISMHILSSGT